MSYIKVINLHKTIKKIEILNNINLELEKGKIYGFYGRNGSGKSMLFRAISGLIIPTKGDVYVNGKHISKDRSFPESMGLIIENVGFWPWYTGFKCLKLLSSIKNIINNDDIINTLNRVDLDPYSKKTYKQYSLGMKQKLGIAQAIMEKPELIILDEPTNALDVESIDNIRKILNEERERGATILIASHNMDDINMLSDEKFSIDKGILKFV